MTSPFERDDIDYLILENDEGQHTLWPEIVAVPIGWSVTHGPSDRTSCLTFVETTWTDMRPKSLIKNMGEGYAKIAESEP
jgi:MbtH protein